MMAVLCLLWRSPNGIPFGTLLLPRPKRPEAQIPLFSSDVGGSNDARVLPTQLCLIVLLQPPWSCSQGQVAEFRAQGNERSQGFYSPLI